MVKKERLTVIDFFCGAGGFSEGFRQQGFKIIKGIDNWGPAIATHNLNHDLDDQVSDVLDFEGKNTDDVINIQKLPNSDLIIGSPPCVLFSMANKAGKADKTLGIRLIEAYLRVIAVKKHQKNSILKAWLMENVPNSKNYIKPTYTFNDLKLHDWARRQGLKPDSAALNTNGIILNASNFGAPQKRDRFVCGEITTDGTFPMPKITHEEPIALKKIKSKIPKPNSKKSTRILSQDPNYPSLKIPVSQLTDHFYDTGLYITEWEQAKYLKTMHPFMGRMSFPENEDKPSRTITATRSVSTRESIIYRSEFNRKGHGEYRLPTIREAASLMGYPYSYQFVGSETTKWKLIGNSVSPQLSAALAKAILQKQGYITVLNKDIDFNLGHNKYLYINNLNTFSSREFKHAKARKKNARFRRSVYKGENITVDFLNYRPGSDDIPGSSWYVGVFYGTGKGHRHNFLKSENYQEIYMCLKTNHDFFEGFIQELEEILGANLTSHNLQRTYEQDCNISRSHNPLVITNQIRGLCEKYAELRETRRFNIRNLEKSTFSIEQLLHMFSLLFLTNRIAEYSLKTRKTVSFKIDEAIMPLNIT